MATVLVRWAQPDAPVDAERLLTPLEHERLEQLTRADDRDRFRSAHVLARIAVAERLQIDRRDVTLGATCARCGGPHGQPVLLAPRESGLRVSLAHAADRVVVAVAARPVGVDVEPLGSASLDVAPVALSVAEHAHLARLPADERTEVLTRWWVRKEAAVKASGHGLAIDLRTVEVGDPAREPKLVGWAGHRGRYRLQDLHVGPAHTAAVATGGRRRPPLDVQRTDLSRWG